MFLFEQSLFPSVGYERRNKCSILAAPKCRDRDSKNTMSWERSDDAKLRQFIRLPKQKAPQICVDSLTLNAVRDCSRTVASTPE